MILCYVPRRAPLPKPPSLPIATQIQVVAHRMAKDSPVVALLPPVKLVFGAKILAKGKTRLIMVLRVPTLEFSLVVILGVHTTGAHALYSPCQICRGEHYADKCLQFLSARHVISSANLA